MFCMSNQFLSRLRLYCGLKFRPSGFTVIVMIIVSTCVYFVTDVASTFLFYGFWLKLMANSNRPWFAFMTVYTVWWWNLQSEPVRLEQCLPVVWQRTPNELFFCWKLVETRSTTRTSTFPSSQTVFVEQSTTGSITPCRSNTRVSATSTTYVVHTCIALYLSWWRNSAHQKHLSRQRSLRHNEKEALWVRILSLTPSPIVFLTPPLDTNWGRGHHTHPLHSTFAEFQIRYAAIQSTLRDSSLSLGALKGRLKTYLFDHG